MENNTLYNALVAACGEPDNKYKTAEFILVRYNKLRKFGTHPAGG